jgi:hypothetical protein
MRAKMQRSKLGEAVFCASELNALRVCGMRDRDYVRWTRFVWLMELK